MEGREGIDRLVLEMKLALVSEKVVELASLLLRKCELRRPSLELVVWEMRDRRMLSDMKRKKYEERIDSENQQI